RSELELGVTDPAARLGQTEELLGIEHLLVEGDRRRGVANAEIDEGLVDHGAILGLGSYALLSASSGEDAALFVSLGEVGEREPVRRGPPVDLPLGGEERDAHVGLVHVALEPSI